VPLSQGAGTPSNTMWPGPMPLSVPSVVFIHPAVWPQWTWSKIGWGWVCLFSAGSWVPIEHKVDLAEAYLLAWAEAYLHTK